MEQKSEISDQALANDHNLTFEVLARPVGLWNNTGIHIGPGEQITVEYLSGTWYPNPGWHSGVDATGHSAHTAGDTYLVPTALEGCLVGKVGGDHIGGGSKPFAIGKLASVPAGLVGALWLTVNDENKWQAFSDNTGSIRVKISVARV